MCFRTLVRTDEGTPASNPRSSGTDAAASSPKKRSAVGAQKEDNQRRELAYWRLTLLARCLRRRAILLDPRLLAISVRIVSPKRLLFFLRLHTRLMF